MELYLYTTNLRVRKIMTFCKDVCLNLGKIYLFPIISPIQIKISSSVVILTFCHDVAFFVSKTMRTAKRKILLQSTSSLSLPLLG